tara:strand:- start:1514 stop:3163 length:1650 start_codon:yes stop_codon:yes gene_type:complete
MADAVDDDPVRRVTEAKVLEALGKFKPGLSDLERIYMASGIDPIYGPDVDYNLDYQLLAGQPYANYLTTTGTPVGGGTGSGTGGISKLPEYTIPSTPSAEDFKLNVVNLPETTETTRNTDVGSTRDQDFFSPGRLYGDYAKDFDFSKFDGEPIDWQNTRLAERAKKEFNKLKGKNVAEEGADAGIKALTGMNAKDLEGVPIIGGLLSMGEQGIAALSNLLFGNRRREAAAKKAYEDLTNYDVTAGYYDEAETDKMVKDALDIDFDALFEGEEENKETPAWIVRARNREKQKALTEARRLQEVGKGKPRYGHVDAPGSAWKVSTPHLDQYVPTFDRDTGEQTGYRLSAANLGAKGFGGISGRMLPKSSGSWEGDNPFGRDYQPPSPGDPRYKDYIAASMGPSDSMLREIEESVARQVPFVEMNDGQGNSYLINKETQAIIAGPFPSGDDSISSIPSIGSMAEGGLAAFAKGDLVENFPRKNGRISGPGTERSDDIPAMLSDGEFVTNAAALRGIGQMAGAPSNDKAEQRRLGAREMYKLQRKGMKAAGVG